MLEYLNVIIYTQSRKTKISLDIPMGTTLPNNTVKEMKRSYLTKEVNNYMHKEKLNTLERPTLASSCFAKERNA